MHQFSTEPFQIMLACLQSGGIKAHAASQANSLQKFVLRELRLYEAAASGKRFHLSIRDRRWAEEKQAGLSENLGDDVQSEDDDEDDGSPVKGSKKDEAWQRGKRYEIDHDATVDDPPQDELDAYTAENDLSGPMPKKPSIDSPMWNYMYGQLMLTARSHHTSLCKYPHEIPDSSLLAPGIRNLPQRPTHMPPHRSSILYALAESPSRQSESGYGSGTFHIVNAKYRASPFYSATASSPLWMQNRSKRLNTTLRGPFMVWAYRIWRQNTTSLSWKACSAGWMR